MRIHAMKKNALKTLSILAAATAVLTGCQKHIVQSQSSPIAYLYLAQESPDAPAMDVYFNMSMVNTQPFGYPQTTQHYLQINPGLYAFQFTIHGTQTVIATASDSLHANTPYSLFLYDTAASLKTMIIQDSFASASSTSAYVRFLDLSPGADTVDLYQNTNKLLSLRTFADNVQQPSLAIFQSVDPGIYTFTAIDHQTGDTLGSQANMLLQNGMGYTLVLRGLPHRTDSLATHLDYMLNQ